MDVFRLMLVSLVGWVNQQQEHMIDYLQEGIRVMKEQRESKRMRSMERSERLGGLLCYYRDVA